MKLKIILLFVTLLPSLCFGQQLTLVTTLQNSIEETSGLINLDGRLITHNDSGSQPILYELDSVSGNVTRSVTIKNATNTDAAGIDLIRFRIGFLDTPSTSINAERNHQQKYITILILPIEK